MALALKGILAMWHSAARSANSNAIGHHNFSAARCTIGHPKNTHTSATSMRQLVLTMSDNVFIACTHCKSIAVLLIVVVGNAQMRAVAPMVVKEGKEYK